MDPLSGSLAFATIVQLMGVYRQEKSSTEVSDFLDWLESHGFEEFKRRIQSLENLQEALQAFLLRDSDTINSKLDLISDSIVSLALNIEGLSGIASATTISSDSISQQAIAILRAFEESGAEKLGVFDEHPSLPPLALFPNNSTLEVKDRRFLADDIDILEGFGFIKFKDTNGSGNPLYALTRLGSKFAQNLSTD